VPKGIPHSEFLSWADEDQDKALQWALAEGQKCPHCGTVPADWLDANGRYVFPDPYVVRVNACVGCQILEEEKKAAEKTGEDMTGVYMSLVENPDG